MPDEPRLAPEQARHNADKNLVDHVCDRFEEQWKADNRPRLETFLEDVPARLHREVMQELLIVEIEYRLLDGQQVECDEYRQRFPDHGHEIEYAWRVVTSEFEPETRRDGSESACDDTRHGEQRPGAPQVLDGRRYAARDEWAADDATAPTDTPGAVVMHCEMTNIRFHARGGLGVVCLASDARLNRSMALKFIRGRLARDAASRDRLRLEAEITSRLEHPGVVPVYGIGETVDGRLFYAMRFIQGETLDAAIDRYHKEMAGAKRSAEHDATMRTLLGHFVAVCKTVAYAHTRGIVHRDIKPANIMLGRFGETTLVDWGLATTVRREGVFKVANEQTMSVRSGSESPEASGDVVGTPAYMSPEQACGTASLQPSSDIYSLGATLYKLITGVPPLSGPLESMRTRVQCGDFRRPTELNKRASKALEAVCLKAMSLEPFDRYETALDLAQDVERFLGDADVAAYREPPLRRAARWARRHWAGVQVAGAGFLLLTTVALVAAVALNRQARQESVLKMAAEVSRASEHELRRQSLSASAEFAAQVIANQVDIRWCILEKIANDTRLHAALQAVNADAQEESRRALLQTWLDEMAAAHASLSFRSLHVNAEDGTQVARHPSTDSEGRRMESLGQNFRYRDYFHGLGEELPDDTETQPPPLTMPHVSAVIESTYAAELTVVFSVPVRVERASAPCGVLAMTVHLGGLAALDVGLPPGQQILLVDTRRYSVRRVFPEPHDERGEGLVLFHEALTDLRGLRTLPHVDDATVQRLLDVKKRILTPGRTSSMGNLLPSDFADPVSADRGGPHLAACAPVIVQSRPEQFADTGWFVIIQQEF